MQYNNDFHLRHQLVDASQMLGEFESFHCNRNVHNVSQYGKPNFFPAPHFILCVDYQIPGKYFSIANGESRKFLFLYPLPEKAFGTYVKQCQCFEVCLRNHDVIFQCYEVFVIHHDLIYEPFDS